MSRIGKLKVAIPEKVNIKVDQQLVSVEGPKGKLEKSFDRSVTIAVGDDGVSVNPSNNSRLAKAMHGTARSIIANMVEGVVKGFEKNLVIEGVGFRAAVNGDILDLALGYSHPINYKIPAGINVTVTDATKIKVAGVDKQMVGSVAADIKHYYKPEPYKGKGVHIIGEFVRRKEGKTVG